MRKGLTLNPWVLGLIEPSPQRVNINPLGTGLTLTLWVLGLILPSAQRVNINPFGYWV